MRKTILLLSLLFAFTNNQSWANSGDDPEILGADYYATTDPGSILRIPTNVDVLVGVSRHCIIIKFSGDFGEGRYHLSSSSGDVAVGTLTATAGGFVMIPFDNELGETTTLELDFVNGKHCTLTW